MRDEEIEVCKLLIEISIRRQRNKMSAQKWSECEIYIKKWSECEFSLQLSQNEEVYANSPTRYMY